MALAGEFNSRMCLRAGPRSTPPRPPGPADKQQPGPLRRAAGRTPPKQNRDMPMSAMLPHKHSRRRSRRRSRLPGRPGRRRASPRVLRKGTWQAHFIQECVSGPASGRHPLGRPGPLTSSGLGPYEGPPGRNPTNHNRDMPVSAMPCPRWPPEARHQASTCGSSPCLARRGPGFFNAALTMRILLESVRQLLDNTTDA